MRLRRKNAEPLKPTARQRQQSMDKPGLRSSYAYHNRRSDYEQNIGRQTDRPAEPPKQQKLWSLLRSSGIGGLLLLIVIFGALVSIVSVASSVKIVESDNQNSALLRNQSEYATTAAEILRTSILNRNKLTIDAPAVRSGLLKEYPELAEVSVTLPLIAHKPVVHLVAEQPAIILATRNGEFIVSLSGKALLLSTNAPDSAKLALPVVTGQSGLEARANQQVLPANQVAFIRTVLAQMKAKGVGVSSLTLPKDTSEFDVQVSGQPYLVKYNLQRPNDARAQAGTFIATQNQLKSQNIIPAKYIDVRLAGRAYYQ